VRPRRSTVDGVPVALFDGPPRVNRTTPDEAEVRTLTAKRIDVKYATLESDVPAGQS
jgi:hypothetical protein